MKFRDMSLKQAGRRQRLLLLVVVLTLSVSCGVALGAKVSGRVFLDGVEKGIAAVAVSDGTDAVATGPDGRYTIDADDEARFIFIAVPEGYAEKGVFYHRLPADVADGYQADFALLEDPASRDREFSFVVCNDVHTYKASHIPEVIQSVALSVNRMVPAARFVVEAGDLVNYREKKEYAFHKKFTDALNVPFWATSGNHDTLQEPPYWGNYEEIYGQTYYARQYGAYTFVFLSWAWSAKPIDRQFDWLETILPLVAKDRYVIVVTHNWEFFSRTKGGLQRVFAILAPYDVRAKFEGHWEMMRTYQVRGIPTFSSSCAKGKPRDMTTGGFRIVRVSGSGEVSTQWRPGGIEKRLVLIAPKQEVLSGEIPVAVNAFDSGIDVQKVTVTFNGNGVPSHTAQLSSAGYWTWAGKWQAAEGTYDVNVIATDSAGKTWTAQRSVKVLSHRQPSPAPLTNWPHYRGNPARTGSTDTTVAPPLYLSWTHPTGQMFGAGSPVVSSGKVYVGMEDDRNIGTPDAGLLCLDAKTGKKVWKTSLKNKSFRGTPSIANGRIAVLADDGTTVLYDETTGDLLWEKPSRPLWGDPDADNIRVLFSSSTLLLNDTLFSGNGALLGRYDVETGEPMWKKSGDLHRMRSWVNASPAVSDGILVLGWKGIAAYRIKDGAVAWEYSKKDQKQSKFMVIESSGKRVLFREIGSTAAIADGKAVFVTSRGVHIVCTDLKTGKLLWTTPQDHGGYPEDWQAAMDNTAGSWRVFCLHGGAVYLQG